ncbi:L-lactate dehydrogenase [Metamycoplasma arthritidis]|uniref:lactate/malate family dehydrogenase n=1 Tax=Metamycoplasma arthritidis TaxID=2111 RepID=UPI001004E44F|nr:lactate dehydrogenase [Metamycoplasma arthritidis]VEU78579.1 L-lactate dehydrogenase [Metamycoplasma arthritidis]
MIKIGIIGVGAVGSSYLYACLNQNIEANYVLIDNFEPCAIAQAKDLNDAACAMPSNGSYFRSGTYNDLSDAEILVITASVRPKNDKLADRLELLNDNAKLMKDIANKVVAAGFKGITVIASNPVDIMASVYQQATQFDASKVISSGTILETARLKKFIAEKLNIKASAISGYVIGEHGARCIIPFSQIRLGMSSFLSMSNDLDENYQNSVCEKVKNEAFEIIAGKGITNFGIGESLCQITSAIIGDKNAVFSLGVQLPSEYKHAGSYFGLPVILGKNGYSHLPKIMLSKVEQKMFDDYSKEIKETVLMLLKENEIKATIK